MHTAIKLLGQAQAGTGATVIYTVPAYPPSIFARVNAIWLCNTDTSTRTLTLRIGTGTLAAANSLLEAASIPANTTTLLSGGEWILTLGAGTKIEALADVAAKVTVTICGDESQ